MTRRNRLTASRARRSFLLGGLAAVAGTGAVRTAARAAQFTWKINMNPSADHPMAVRVSAACEKIRRDTNGQVEITVFPNSGLGGAEASFQQLRIGALEMYAQSGGIMTFVPVASIMQIAYAFADRPTAFRAMDGDLGALIRNEFPSKGFVALDRVYENGYRHFTSGVKPIRTVADLQGLKLRVVPAKLALDTFRSMGAGAVGIEVQELYLALQSHLVDGQESPLAFIETFRFYEVQKYLALSHHMWDCFWILVNAEKWQGLPAAYRETIRHHFNEGALLERRDIEVQEGSLRDKLHRQGLAINDVDVASFKAKLTANGYYARWRDEFGPAAWSALEKYAGRLG